MGKRPEDRFQSAAEVAKLLEECLAHVQQPTAVPLPTYSPLPPGEGQGVREAARSLSCRPEQAQRSSGNALVTSATAGTALRLFRPTRSRKTFIKGTLAMLTLIGISLFAVGVASNPPDISGAWQGEDWGQITLKQTAPGEYTGTYTDTVAKEKGPGMIELKWSRIERRYNGTWREGEDDRFGDLSIRLADRELHGGLTTSEKSKINPATPRLGDLVWIRVNEHADNVPKPASLAEAVRAFNSHAHDDALGRDQPPLTEDEVVTAIRWALVDPRKLDASDTALKRLHEIAETRI